MPEPKMMLPSKGVNIQWLTQLELLQADISPLPGGSVQRGVMGVDPRLTVRDAKSTDVITIYEHVCSLRHKATNRFYVAFRETKHALLLRQADPVRYPAWLMRHPVKMTELRTFVARVKPCLNPIAMVKQLVAIKGIGELWLYDWLDVIEDDWEYESLAYFLITNNYVNPEMFAKG